MTDATQTGILDTPAAAAPRDASEQFFSDSAKTVLRLNGYAGVPTVLGAGVYAFACLVFINLHHYFLDSAMWRRGNPDMQNYLFGRA